ncbi:MAG TPA: IPT/TIG domain-containing protein [Kofleriaceae bacterium]|nr:IPT/TIG domain-containing protein [Kofleriaceae bacterium]
MRKWIALGGIVFSAACGSSGSDIKCGDGTTLDNGECVPQGSGSGVTCGAGTQLDSTGTMCIPTPPGATGAPTITGISENEGGISGGDLFEIQGTGFAGDDVTALHVYFGATTPGSSGDLGPCEALIGPATATVITGQVPPDCTFSTSITITVQTNLGMATTPYLYDALFLADGDDFYLNEPGHIYVVDPEAAKSFDLGNLVDSQGGTYNLDGMAFAGNTLYGVTTGDSEADLDGVAQLVTIDLSTYDPTAGTVTVTPVSDLFDEADDAIYASDLRVIGTTLYAWGYACSDGCAQGLVTIDPTGSTSFVETSASETSFFGALAVDGTGALTAAPNGAYPDTANGATGELDSVDVGTGALTSTATLDWGIGAPITTMMYAGTTLLGVVDNGTYSAMVYDGETYPSYFGQTLAVIDPTATPIVGATILALPEQIGAQARISAMDIPPTTFVIARQVPTDRWKKLPAIGLEHQPQGSSIATAHANIMNALHRRGAK